METVIISKFWDSTSIYYCLLEDNSSYAGRIYRDDWQNTYIIQVFRNFGKDYEPTCYEATCDNFQDAHNLLKEQLLKHNYKIMDGKFEALL